jgi:CO dehydrogenase/acetyl-CoA synthase epsilon subunit
VDQLADAEVKGARATKLPIVATMAETNAAVSRRIASAYVAVARNLLQA